jgi:hypothetical protein
MDQAAHRRLEGKRGMARAVGGGARRRLGQQAAEFDAGLAHRAARLAAAGAALWGQGVEEGLHQRQHRQYCITIMQWFRND